MYAYIKGTLEETGSGWIVIDNQGIGYQMQVSARLMEELPMIGTEVKIYTYLNVKEDAMSLFGFLSKDICLFFYFPYHIFCINDIYASAHNS